MIFLVNLVVQVPQIRRDILERIKNILKLDHGDDCTTKFTKKIIELYTYNR